MLVISYHDISPQQSVYEIVAMGVAMPTVVTKRTPPAQPEITQPSLSNLWTAELCAGLRTVDQQSVLQMEAEMNNLIDKTLLKIQGNHSAKKTPSAHTEISVCKPEGEPPSLAEKLCLGIREADQQSVAILREKMSGLIDKALIEIEKKPTGTKNTSLKPKELNIS
ncbi:MAG: hypothetical protein WC612_00605 [Bdellovibrionales bacterium]|jgi:hypothetical protein